MGSFGARLGFAWDFAGVGLQCAGGLLGALMRGCSSFVCFEFAGAFFGFFWGCP